MKKIIFALEDEESIRELYKYALSDYHVHAFELGEEMFRELEKIIPDLFILDIMLPDTDGGAVLSRLRSDARFKNIPVIMVSAKGDEMSKVKLLNMGADDYLSKPFGIMELGARVMAALRRSEKNTLSFAGITISESEHAIKIDSAAVSVGLKEYMLLKYLLENSDKVCSRESLLSNIWGINFEGETRTLDMHIKMLRDKIADSGAEITTVRGVGYMLRAK